VDMLMPPGWDGLTTIEHLWRADPAIQIVICTAYSDRSWSEILGRVGNTDQLLILKKPFDPVEVAQLAHGLSHKWRAVAAERDLLERTLGGSVQVLGELLALLSPAASARAASVQGMVQHATRRLKLTHWAYRLAAGMSQLGCVMLPADLVENQRAGRKLGGADASMFRGHPTVAAKLIRQVPRLELVADIVEQQFTPPPVRWERRMEKDDRWVAAMGSQLLCTALALDMALQSGETITAACEQIARHHPEPIVKALSSYRRPQVEHWIQSSVNLAEVRPGMVLEEPVTTEGGTVVCPANTQITAAMGERLWNFAKRIGLEREFRVRVPAALVNNAKA
ncbi:MAG: HD domain-containing phosphohydrolase, partial [Myxococcota bacterium]